MARVSMTKCDDDVIFVHTARKTAAAAAFRGFVGRFHKSLALDTVLFYLRVEALRLNASTEFRKQYRSATKES